MEEELTIGAEVLVSDGECGKLRRVVIDPLARVVTHLVVEPSSAARVERLVPIALVDDAADGIRLRCTLAEFNGMETADETRFIPGASGEWNYGQNEMLSLPYFGLGLWGYALGTGTGRLDADTSAHSVTYDRVPVGKVEVRRGERVHAIDGDIGRVQGLVVDPRDHHVTHVLLQDGHLWDKRQIAIPISAVARIDDGVRLGISKDEVRDLPEVPIEGT